MHIPFGEYDERLSEIQLYVAHVNTEAGSALELHLIRVKSSKILGCFPVM